MRSIINWNFHSNKLSFVLGLNNSYIYITILRVKQRKDGCAASWSCSPPLYSIVFPLPLLEFFVGGDAGLLFDVYAMCPWCSMHLKCSDWYFNVALCYDTPIDELLHYTPDCAFDGSSYRRFCKKLSLWLFV